MDKRLTRSARPVRPARAVAGRVAPGGAGPRKSGAAAANSSGATRILAVDDTAKDLRDLRNALKATHAEVFASQNGKAAIEFLSRELVDLVVLDVLMPEMDGYEVCRHLKHDPRTRDIPIIFVSGDVAHEDKHKGLELGAWDYISKPIDQQEVEIRVNNALEIKQARDKLKVSTIIPEDQAKKQLEIQQKIEDFEQGMMTTHWHKRFGQLAANFIDEIKTPLHAALGNVQLLMVDDQLPTGTRDKLAMLYTNFRYVDEKLKRLVRVSERLPHPQIVQVGQIVNDSIHLLALELHYYQIELVTQIDPSVQWVGLPSELGRAVLYLLHNAIESVTYRPRIYAEFTNDEEAEPVDVKQPDVREPVIKVTVELDESQINIDVMDNGPNVLTENLETIFDPHFTTKGPPHTGAGLHLARSIARAGGGELVVFSPNNEKLNQFTLALPLFDPDMYEIEVEEDAEEVELIGEESGGPVDLNDIMADDSDEKTTGTE
ncbi:MAG: CheY-like chemotaxis protein [Yoonia sp.]|jgi:CheY-like chemotaxis protein